MRREGGEVRTLPELDWRDEDTGPTGDFYAACGAVDDGRDTPASRAVEARWRVTPRADRNEWIRLGREVPR